MVTEILHLFYFALLNISVILVGYQLIKLQKQVWGWLLLIFSVTSIFFIFITEAPVLKMLVLIATTFTCMKVISVAGEFKQKELTLTFTQWLAFAVGWVGMRAKPFETLGNNALPYAWPMIGFGISRIAGGATLILAAHYITSLPEYPVLTYIVVSITLLIGFSLILHFGLLGISAGIWRLSGANTYVLFRQPAKATSINEFWSKRWNLAFSEMTSITIYRPLKNKYGSAIALVVAFMFSGLLHEVAISLPVHSGYGLPMLYFLIQALLVLLEKVLQKNKAAFLQHRLWSRAWVLLGLVVPMPLLFHEQFIKQIVWPLAGLSLP